MKFVDKVPEVSGFYWTRHKTLGELNVQYYNHDNNNSYYFSNKAIINDCYEEESPDDFLFGDFVPLPEVEIEKKIEELTVAEISERLGYQVKVVKG